MMPARDYIGKRVVTRSDSGWGKGGDTGLARPARRYTIDTPWFFFIPDDGTNPDGILAHTDEFDILQEEN